MRLWLIWESSERWTSAASALEVFNAWDRATFLTVYCGKEIRVRIRRLRPWRVALFKNVFALVVFDHSREKDERRWKGLESSTFQRGKHLKYSLIGLRAQQDGHREWGYDFTLGGHLGDSENLGSQ